jgi:hypothetical protein
VSAVKYELGFYIPEDGILQSHRRENLKSYIALTGLALKQRRNMSPVEYELGFYIPEDGILHSHCRENFKSYSIKLSTEQLQVFQSSDVNCPPPSQCGPIPTSHNRPSAHQL